MPVAKHQLIGAFLLTDKGVMYTVGVSYLYEASYLWLNISRGLYFGGLFFG